MKRCGVGVRRRLLLWVCCVVALAGGCGGEDLPYELRSIETSSDYAVNNASASERLQALMYNRTDTAHPVERFKLVHISDPHLSGWSADNNYAHPNNLLEAVSFANQGSLRINAMVETGDHISNDSRVAALLYMESFFRYLYADNSVPTFTCFGNHDANIDPYHPNQSLSLSERLGLFGSYGNAVVKRPSENVGYYYVDVSNPQGGEVRLIALDMLDCADNTYDLLHWAVFSQGQIDWLANVALKEGMTAQHSVIVLTHFPFQPSMWVESKGAVLSPLYYLNNGDFVQHWQMVPEIINAYRHRTTLRKSWANKLHIAQSLSAAYDFSGSVGEFVCYLGGHAHCFAVFDVEATQSSTMPAQKMILCTNQSPSEVGGVYNKVLRQPNSVSSNSFNIYAIDTREKKVYITFFGAWQPEDNPDFSPIQSFSWGAAQ